MKKKVIIYFILFGLVFGIINELDTTGGDIPYSKMLNFPTLYTQGIVNSIFNSLERGRFEELKQEIGTTDFNPSLSSDEFEKLTPKEQEEFVSKMKNQKNTARNDTFIGENGSLYFIRNLFSFPILSAMTWGIIGFLYYLVRKRVNTLKLTSNKP